MTIPDAARAVVRAEFTEALPDEPALVDRLTRRTFAALMLAGYAVVPELTTFGNDRAECPVCRREFALTFTGHVRQHGQRTNPCAGSGSRPNTEDGATS